MESFKSMLDYVTELAWMGSVDLTDAFFVVSIKLGHRKWLKFFWRRQLFEFCVMPFGSAISLKKFSCLTRRFLAKMHQMTFNIADYLDDFFQWKLTCQLCLLALRTSYRLLVNLGFLPNMEKSVLIPTQTLQCLGFVICSITMMVSLPHDKQCAIVQPCTNLLCMCSIPIHLLASLIRSLISIFPAVP